jgi:hypothetical protein
MPRPLLELHFSELNRVAVGFAFLSMNNPAAAICGNFFCAALDELRPGLLF